MYQKVAYIGLRNTDGSYMMNIPLYVEVNKVGKTGLTEMQEGLIHRVSEIMIRHYERQIGEYINSRKEEKNGTIQG